MRDGTRSGARSSYGVTAVGIILAGLVVLRATMDGEPLVDDVREGSIALVLSTLVAVLGVSLDRFDVRPDDVGRVFAWTFLGGTATAAATGWFVYFQAAEGTPVAEPYLAMATPTALGTLAGTIVGIYDAERRAALARIEAERENLALLHRLLRHNVRNGINVIQGRVDSLGRGSLDERERRDLSIVDRRADRIANLVERVRLLTDRSRNLRPVALGPAVAAAAETVRDATPGAVDVRTTVPSDAHVRADEGLSELIELLLVDAIERTDAADPTVTVTATPKGSLVVLEVASAGGEPATEGAVGPETGTESGARTATDPDSDSDSDSGPGSGDGSAATADRGLGIVAAGRGFLRSLADRYDGTVALETGETALVATLRRTDPAEDGGAGTADGSGVAGAGSGTRADPGESGIYPPTKGWSDE